IVMPVILGQIIGRFGNFVNQEAFGPPTDLPWKMWVAVNNRPTGFEDFAYFHPTFLYEVIGLIILFVILRLFRDRLKLSGSRFWIYIIGYSILRYFVEYFRVDSDFWGSLTVAQWGSLVLIVIGVILFNLRLKSKLKP
ncbi:MAG: prolipoprotein diacylglyceryl transferase family protein, partial [Patescibacteria group bacterium]|nr:prolipoprotein diacylglyceryl transferase family protein [Patescibacteria group bacterium]